jgi:uncharacterized protein
MDAELTVRDNAKSHMYEALIDGEVIGTITYMPMTPQHIVFISTVIDPRLRGRGIGALLVKAALDDVRTKGAAISSQCWFVDEFIDAYPEYADLVHDAAR